MAETFHGYVDTTQDVLLIFEGCRRGLLPKVNRRLQERERKLIRSGSVFVFDERESGVKRWTDGLVWSPSRILGNFLIYRELEKRNGEKRLSVSDQRQRSYSVDVSSTIAAAGGGGNGGLTTDRVKEKRLVGSLSDVYNFKVDGLIKKTMSIVVNGSTQHLISYYHPQDIIDNKLRTPSSVPELTSLEISPELLVKQNFRIPPFVEPTLDSTTDTSVSTNLAVHPHQQQHQQRQYQQHYPVHQHQYQGQQIIDRNGHSNNNNNNNGTTVSHSGSSLRSMSVGSLNSLKQESLLYGNQQPSDSSVDYDPYHGNMTPASNSSNKSTGMFSLYFQQQQQQQHQQQQQQQQQQVHPISATSTSSTSNVLSSSSVYSPLPASTPSPNSIRYDMPPHPHLTTNYDHEDQKYPTPSNPQLGHLLNPVHSRNAPTPADSYVHHDSTSVRQQPGIAGQNGIFGTTHLLR
ncbi:Gti1/Pac2 family-domain-containing protein [Absidia repens]|uniref:Gti1/Pac2 family-domain-containing protein n=1 Tax=Absidia repens TaxID=90262 RepID=A0A1X2IBZ1_9FUNG|nr:Gti1/Pac2 family-domain-containing protein [Absidia repens]